MYMPSYNSYLNQNKSLLFVFQPREVAKNPISLHTMVSHRLQMSIILPQLVFVP